MTWAEEVAAMQRRESQIVPLCQDRRYALGQAMSWLGLAWGRCPRPDRLRRPEVVLAGAWLQPLLTPGAEPARATAETPDALLTDALDYLLQVACYGPDLQRSAAAARDLERAWANLAAWWEATR